MGRGLSDLQKKIIVVMWHKRCEFDWPADFLGGGTWIGPGSEDDYIDDEDIWEDERNWIGKLDQDAQGKVRCEVIGMADDTGRQKRQTTVIRAVSRLAERGVIDLSCRNMKYAEWTLTSWGSLLGWMLSEGRPLNGLASRKFPVPAKDEPTPTLEESEEALDRIAHPEKYAHERVIASIAGLEPWQQEIVYEHVRLMVETPTIVDESTDRTETGLMVETGPLGPESTDSRS